MMFSIYCRRVNKNKKTKNKKTKKEAEFLLILLVKRNFYRLIISSAASEGL